MSDAQELEVMPMTATAAIEKANIDSQIATAKQYPRSMTSFKKRATELATLDDETAESCLYRRPVGGGKFAEGMSVRMAEIVASCFGNLRVQAILVEQTPRYVKARGMAIDLETNFAASSEVIESTVNKHGEPYSERQAVVVAKAALAKARRDATFQVVPKALAKPVEQAVKKLLRGDAKTMQARREGVVAWIKKLGIDEARVWRSFSINGEDELTMDILDQLTGIRTAIKERDTTIDEAFPEIEKHDIGGGLADVVNQTAKDQSPKEETSQEAPKEDPPKKKAPAKKKAAPKKTAKKEEKPAEPEQPATTDIDRDALIEEIQDKMLDSGISESKLFSEFKVEFGEVEGVDELWALPTAQLVLAKKTLDRIAG